MLYDVKNAALAFLQDVKDATEGALISAKVEAMSKERAFFFLRNKLAKLEDVVNREQNFLGLYKHNRGSELSERRASLREKKRELKAVRAEARKARSACDCAWSAVEDKKSFLHKVCMVYTHVERSWISGCVVSSKPCFSNLIPE